MKKINTLCLVDDDLLFQLLTQTMIEQTLLVDQIKIFSNGLEAIDFLKSVKNNPKELPEVILLDLSMPVMDGWEFMEEYLTLEPKLDKKITLYVVSSSVDPVDIERAKSIDAVTDFIIKPVTTEKFMNLLKNL